MSAGKGDRNRISNFGDFRSNYENISFKRDDYTSDKIIIIGDTHGEWDKLTKDSMLNLLEGSLLIHVGDVGIGFKSPTREWVNINKLNEVFKLHNITFLGIRGNHDDPSFFDGCVNLSNFKLLTDYSTLIINGKMWQFIGGAVSVDRKRRSDFLDYWLNERFTFDSFKAKKCDILITHTGPSYIGPHPHGGHIKYFLDRDDKLLDDLIHERNEMDKLVEICKPKHHYIGHFHRSERLVKFEGDKPESVTKILDIFEMVEHVEDISY